MLKFLIGNIHSALTFTSLNIHSALTLASLSLNGGTFTNTIFSKYLPVGNEFFAKQYEDAKKVILPKLTDYPIVAGGLNFIESLKWNSLKCSEKTSLFSVDGAIHSGAAGLLELRFSKFIVGQTTHFGVVVPALKLAYGEEWSTDGKVLIGLGSIAAFETAYWALDCGNESHPEI